MKLEQQLSARITADDREALAEVVAFLDEAEQSWNRIDRASNASSAPCTTTMVRLPCAFDAPSRRRRNSLKQVWAGESRPEDDRLRR